MDLSIRYIPYEANKWTVTRAIALILHADDFAPNVKGGEINFRVELNRNPAGGISHNGTGLLTLPTAEVGTKFLAYIFKDPIEIKKKKLRFKKVDRPPPEWLVLTLRKTRYVNPDIEEARDEKLSLLDSQPKLRVTAVQFGLFFQQHYPRTEKEPCPPRAFSIEWELSYDTESGGRGQLSFDYNRELIRITLENDPTTGEDYVLSINFANIQKIGTGRDGPASAYICFDTLVPPTMEKFQIHRPMTGRNDVDFRRYKERVGFLSPTHAPVAPYARHLRVALYNNPYDDVVKNFISMCLIAGLTKSMIVECPPPLQIDALRLGFFSPKRIYNLHKTLARFDWPVAFQLESLLHNGLLNTDEIDALMPQVRELSRTHAKQGAVYVGDLLRGFNEALRLKPPKESPLKCYQRILSGFEFRPPKRKIFRCYHVTFTPTRMLLEGPYSAQSNRVIRKYEGFEDHFIRVDFRDENRLLYRWDREVDGALFLANRVGTILKDGFVLAGRRFDFLAYSSSALREHAVWFMNPFQIDRHKKEMVTAASIRASLGSFEGDLLRQPSKLAARLAQAFTATDPASVDIYRNEWDDMPDLGNEPYLFTDGVGTISKALGDKIWAKLCEGKHDTGLIQPSAYQIRFLGYKGVVAIDEQLDNRSDGIHMRLRPSMKKFGVLDDKVAPLEIAQAFKVPSSFYLNRYLIMVLEDLGVRKEHFQDLQDKAIADAKTIDESILQFVDVLASHGLGLSYRLRGVLCNLRDDLRMDLTSNGQTATMDTPFLREVRQVAMTSVLHAIRHSAHIPVPNSYLLVGVADEGPAYVADGHENVFCLNVGEIYACVQRPNETEPTWLTGTASISRSPVVHPGDVQRVRAIGKPPDDKLCLFRNLVNVVVLPSVGDRSLASYLGGGDVDGDTFAIIFYDSLLPTQVEKPANYKPLDTFDLGRDSTVEDVCDFIVEYINSDVLGLLSDRLLVIADQSNDGIFDDNCLFLAKLCSQAVDYPKQGNPPDMDGDRLPRTLIRCKPDWQAAEVVSPRWETDYYESTRALGYLFRSIKIEDPKPIPVEDLTPTQLLTDPISVALLDQVRPYLQESAFSENHPFEVLKLFRTYCDELRYICATHTISNTPGVRLSEAEVVVGTILAKCSQKRRRSESIYRMRHHTKTLVSDVQNALLENPYSNSISLIHGLGLAWSAWHLSVCHRNDFGANSFGLIALGSVFDRLKALKKL